MSEMIIVHSSLIRLKSFSFSFSEDHRSANVPWRLRRRKDSFVCENKMCSQSISGSSLLSAYDDDDLRETSGRTRRDFEQIDAVLYDEEIARRSSINKICEEWSSKPHFRVRGRQCPMERRWEKRSPLVNPLKISSISMDVSSCRSIDQPPSDEPID